VIGEKVWIGAHAQICANVSVGDGSSIGAGAVVTQDIPQCCLVLGNPGRIAQRDYDNSAFL
jgi:acetyltransferase-like isoleucine patch superfamily enzyme